MIKAQAEGWGPHRLGNMKLATTGSAAAPTGHGLAPREPQLLGEQAWGPRGGEEGGTSELAEGKQELWQGGVR